MALATPNQLWRLNKEGRLLVVPGSTPMTHVEADTAIKQVLAGSAGVVEGSLDGSLGGTSEALEA